jgi:hypothetical protein
LCAKTRLFAHFLLQKRLKTALFALFFTRLSSRIRARYAALLPSQRAHMTALAATRQAHGFCLEKAENYAGSSPLRNFLLSNVRHLFRVLGQVLGAQAHIPGLDF